MQVGDMRMQVYVFFTRVSYWDKSATSQGRESTWTTVSENIFYKNLKIHRQEKDLDYT